MADAFIAIFPFDFPRDEILERYDPMQTSLVWNNFEYALHKLFKHYHCIRALTGPTRRWRLFQVKSVFVYLLVPEDKDKVGEAENVGLPGPYPDVSNPPPNSRDVTQFPEVTSSCKLVKAFQPREVGRCDADFKLFDTSDQICMTELQFFLPLLIWEYNHHKHRLDMHDAKVRRVQAVLQKDKALLSHLLGVPQMSDEPVLSPKSEAPSRFA